VEWLKLKALSSNPSTAKQNKTTTTKKIQAGSWWLMPIILAIWGLISGGSRFKASPGK
jgi:hypothetical protein